MVKESKCYVSSPDSIKRQYIAYEDRTWEAREIDVDSLIQEVARKDDSAHIPDFAGHAVMRGSHPFGCAVRVHDTEDAWRSDLCSIFNTLRSAKRI